MANQTWIHQYYLYGNRMNMSMSWAGQLFPSREKPPLGIPEMDHSLGELHPVNFARKLSQCLPVLLYLPVLSLFQSAIGNKGANSL
jgi:hypothetical protein